MAQRQYISPSFRAKLMLPFGWTLRLPMHPIFSPMAVRFLELIFISRRALGQEGDYKMHHVCVCVS